MDKNEKIVAIATVAIITTSAVLFAVKAKKFRARWEKAAEAIDNIDIAIDQEAPLA